MQISRLAGVVLVVLAACGGGGDDAPKAGAGGKGGGEAKAGSGGGEKGLVCGTKTCPFPAADTDLQPCCMDMFSSMCGTMMAGACQRGRSEGAESCPLPADSVFAFAGSSGGRGVSACCAPNNECGLDLGIGFGCTPNRDVCGQLPKEYIGAVKIMTCDGEVATDQGACAHAEGD
jgi:hypothetical protein